MSRTFGIDFALEAARGKISGVSTINKFGRNTEVDGGVTADVWDGGNTGDVSLIWVAPTQARTHTIASTSASDTTGGVGARTVKIWGLTAWGSVEASETVTMDTASPPVTSNSYVIIHRMSVITKGATSVNVGTITATATTDGTITAQISPGIGGTGMAIYGIPSTQTLYIGRLYGNMNKASGVGAATGYVNASLLYNPEADAELTNFVTRHTFGLSLNGTSALTINYSVPKILPGPAIVKMQIDSGTSNMDISAGWDGFLVTN